jgi:hypothetical protein
VFPNPFLINTFRTLFQKTRVAYPISISARLKMNQLFTNSSSTNHLPRCQYHTRTGRRCRHSVSDAATGLCAKHTQFRPKYHEEGDLTAVLLGQLTHLNSATEINTALTNLFRLLTQDRIAARRAAVLAYIGNLLLRTLPAIDRELNPQADEPQQIIFDLPRPQRDWPTPEPEPKTFSGIPGVTPMPEKKPS